MLLVSGCPRIQWFCRWTSMRRCTRRWDTTARDSRPENEMHCNAVKQDKAASEGGFVNVEGVGSRALGAGHWEQGTGRDIVGMVMVALHCGTSHVMASCLPTLGSHSRIVQSREQEASRDIVACHSAALQSDLCPGNSLSCLKRRRSTIWMEASSLQVANLRFVGLRLRPLMGSL